MRVHLTIVSLVLGAVCLLSQPANAQVSRCLAMAGREVPVVPVKLANDEVSIRFAGHSTFVIESAAGVTIATDYAGYAGMGFVPMVVTMNRAHETHYTDYPDPKIEHVLRGWNPDGGAANHNLQVRDVKIRNVPTNTRHWSGGTQMDGNSIFIFEVAGLCIGHLGHLHHELGAQHVGWIGRLDVVMVPVDGSFTLAHDKMAEVLRTLRAQLVLPMHYFGGGSLNRFVQSLKSEFEVEISQASQIVLSEATLPRSPKVLVLLPQQQMRLQSD